MLKSSFSFSWENLQFAYEELCVWVCKKSEDKLYQFCFVENLWMMIQLPWIPIVLPWNLKQFYFLSGIFVANFLRFSSALEITGTFHLLNRKNIAKNYVSPAGISTIKSENKKFFCQKYFIFQQVFLELF